MGENTTQKALGTILTGGVVLLFASLFHSVLNFVSRILIARNLGPANYGEISIGLAILIFGSNIVILGLNRGLGRNIPRSDSAEQADIVTTAIQIIFPFAIGLSVSLVVTAPNISTIAFSQPRLTPIIRLFSGAIPFAVAMYLSIGVVQGYQRYLPKAIMQNFILPSVVLIGIIVSINLEMGIGGVVSAYVLGYFVAGILGIYYIIRLTPALNLTKYTGKYQSLLSFSIPLMVAMMVLIFIRDINVLMLGVLSTSSAVGLYNSVYPLTKIFSIILFPMAFLFLPIFSELHSKREFSELERIYGLIAKWLMISSMPIAIVFVYFPNQVLLLTFGPEYTSGSLSLTILAVAFFIHSIVGVNENALISIGKTRLIMYDALLVIGILFVLNLVLIPKYSLLGAIASTAFAIIFRAVLYTFQIYQSIEVHPIRTDILRLGSVMIIASVIIYFIIKLLPFDLMGEFLAFVSIFTPIYLGIIFMIGMGSEEKYLVGELSERSGINIRILKELVKRLI